MDRRNPPQPDPTDLRTILAGNVIIFDVADPKAFADAILANITWDDDELELDEASA